MRISPRMLLAYALALGGVMLPVDATAALLAGGTARLPAVVTGVWIFKAALLLHAVLLVVAPRWLRIDASAVAIEDTRDPISATEWILLGVLLSAGLALRLYKLGEGLWFDEIQTLVSYVRLPALQIVSTFDSQNQHMLYALLARGSVRLFGESAWALRLPAALLGVASLAAVFALARSVTGRTEALLATAFLTVSYHHVWFSQNARGYTGLLLFTLIATQLLHRMLTHRSHGWRTPLGYAAAMALAMFTHITAVFVLIAHVLIWAARLLLRRNEIERASVIVPLAAFVLSATFTLQLYALVVPQFVGVLLQPTMEGVATEWKDPIWMVTETLRGLANGLPGGWLAVVAAALVFAAGVFSVWRSDALMGAAMILPPLLLGTMLLVLHHNLWPRFFFFAAGFAVILAMRGARTVTMAMLRHRGPTLATAALGLVVLLSAAQVPAAYRPKQDYAAAERFIAAHRSPTDAVVVVDMSNYAFNTWARANYLSVQNENELRAIERSHAHTWFLYTFPTRLKAIQPELWAHLQSAYQPAAEFNGTIGGGTIFIRVKP